MKGDPHITQDGLPAQAARWFAAMQASDVSTRERAQFCEWLEQSPRHVEEYLEVASLWRRLDATDEARRGADELIAAARADHETTNVVALASFGAAGGTRVRPWRPAAIAATMTLLVAGALAWFVADRHINAGRYATALGEQTSFTLADGSVVRLNTQSAIRVRLEKNERHISLLAGEAMFEVARDPARPFRVYSGRAVAEALGTAFNIRRAGDETRVTVLEGRVRVSAAADGGAPAVAELAPRGRAVVRAAGKMVTDGDASLEQTMAWTARRLIFYSETLAAVVEEFNRYNPQRLKVTDPELAALRISGNFRASDPQSLVQFLQCTESVSAVADKDGMLELFRGTP